MNTKDKIIGAAQMLFLKHGLDGVKMQMVADKAGVNKGLLHYYYKSKAKIFTEVFDRATSELLKDVKLLFTDETLSLDEKISAIVDAYFKLLSKNSHLPVFFVSEMNRSPEILSQLGFGEKIKSLVNSAKLALPDNKPPEFAMQFMLTLISLCVFPFMITPLINELTEDNKKTETMLNDRKELVKQTLINMIQ